MPMGDDMGMGNEMGAEMPMGNEMPMDGDPNMMGPDGGSEFDTNFDAGVEADEDEDDQTECGKYPDCQGAAYLSGIYAGVSGVLRKEPRRTA